MYLQFGSFGFWIRRRLVGLVEAMVWVSFVEAGVSLNALPHRDVGVEPSGKPGFFFILVDLSPSPSPSPLIICRINTRIRHHSGSHSQSISPSPPLHSILIIAYSLLRSLLVYCLIKHSNLKFRSTS